MSLPWTDIAAFFGAATGLIGSIFGITALVLRAKEKKIRGKLFVSLITKSMRSHTTANREASQKKPIFEVRLRIINIGNVDFILENVGCLTRDRSVIWFLHIDESKKEVRWYSGIRLPVKIAPNDSWEGDLVDYYMQRAKSFIAEDKTGKRFMVKGRKARKINKEIHNSFDSQGQ